MAQPANHPHPHPESNPDRLLKSDDLVDLHDGEIFVDEHGKKYRVKKKIMSDHFCGGPHGLGDPNDRTLRRIEADVLVPNRMNSRIEKVDCHEMYMNLVNCMTAEGGAYGLYKCTAQRDALNDCKRARFTDPNFRQQMTEEYLNERAEFRRTGLTSKERKFKEFRDWKKQHEPHPEDQDRK